MECLPEEINQQVQEKEQNQLTDTKDEQQLSSLDSIDEEITEPKVYDENLPIRTFVSIDIQLRICGVEKFLFHSTEIIIQLLRQNLPNILISLNEKHKSKYFEFN